MTRALGPRVPIFGSSSAPGWTVLALCWIPAGLLGVVWAGAKAAAFITGGQVAGYGWGFAGDVAGGHTAVAWPHTPTALVVACTITGTVMLTVAGVAGWSVAARRYMHVPGDPVAALAAHRRQHETLTLAPTARKATTLRAGLHGRDPRHISPQDAGMMLGDLLRPGAPPGPALYSTWEETELDFMGPRAGKTTARAIPLTLSAPGPVLATSNKADLWMSTAALRASKGPVFLFDPCHICWQEQAFWADLLTPVINVEAAHRLASHFVLTVEDPAKRELWGPAAQTLLTCLFLAAAPSSAAGRTMHDVAVWLDQPSNPAPATILKKAGYGKLASSFIGTQNGAYETRDGIYETARTAAKALRDEDVIRWVTPQDGLPVFHPGDFTAGTLYLLSEALSYAAPLIAACTDLVIRSGLRRAQQSGGRLDPPLEVLLDEAANICKIADLPNLYSYMGSHGIVPVTILQSYEQGVSVWGESGMAALWGAATVKMIGAGVHSPKLTKDLSELAGPHDVPVRSIGLGESGRGVSENISFRRQQILESADVAAIPKGYAVLLTSGNRPAMLKLRNWLTGPDAARITADAARGQDLIRAGASGDSGRRP